jgi:hypothetical protein
VWQECATLAVGGIGDPLPERLDTREPVQEPNLLDRFALLLIVKGVQDAVATADLDQTLLTQARHLSSSTISCELIV